MVVPQSDNKFIEMHIVAMYRYKYIRVCIPFIGITCSDDYFDKGGFSTEPNLACL